MKFYYFISPETDAYTNLAYDTYLLNALDRDSVCLLFYVNENAVIIGRNQNPYRECNLDRMTLDGVQLARRVSGGGAVYHDIGNLNYSFLCPADSCSEEEQTQLICRALSQFGLFAEKNGRNDLTLDGKKFSGNAFCTKGKNQMRHGTLMVDCDTEKMSRYLTVSRVKLETKGVKSVRSRVCNLREYSKEITVDSLRDTILDEYRTVYPVACPYPFDEEAEREVWKIRTELSSDAWLYGESPAFSVSLEHRFSFGTTQIQFAVRDGKIADCRVYTDSLDLMISERLQASLDGILFDKNAIKTALSPDFSEVSDVISEKLPGTSTK